MARITNHDVGTARKPVSASAFGIDLSSLDDAARQRALNELSSLNKKLLLLHKQYDLSDSGGVRRATRALGLLAKETRLRTIRAQPEEREVLELFALGMENIALTARISPDSVTELFPNMPSREELTESDSQMLEESRQGFRELVESESGEGGESGGGG